MPIEWEKEQITWKNQGEPQGSQILVEGDIIAPDNKPDIKELLGCFGELSPLDVRTGEERINVSGQLHLNILYTTDKGEHAVYSITTALPVEDIVYIDGLSKDTKVTVQATVAHLDCQLINDRKLNVKAIVTLHTCASDLYSISAVQPSEQGDIAFLYDTLTLEESVADKKDTFLIKEDISLPQALPAIGEILYTTLRLTEQEVRPMDGKIMLRSNLVADVLYSDNTEQGGVHSFSEKIPFNGFLEAENITPKSILSVDLSIAESDIKTALDDDGEARTLSLSATILGDVSAYENVEHTIVTDAYSPSQETELVKKTITYPSTVGTGKNQFTLKEKITISDDEEPMMKAEKTWGNLVIQETKALQDQLQVDGVLMTSILYICQEDNPSVCMIHRGIPFTQTLEMKGVSPSDSIFVKARVEEMDFQTTSEKDGELYASIVLDASAREHKNADIVTEIRTQEAEASAARMPAAIIYTVQKGDSLWSIAKRYGTTIEQILSVNDIENPEQIYPEQKILIVKSRY